MCVCVHARVCACVHAYVCTCCVLCFLCVLYFIGKKSGVRCSHLVGVQSYPTLQHVLVQYITYVHTDLPIICPFVQVYHTLVGVYISPPNLPDLGLTLPKGCQVKPDIPSAIRVLNDHYEQIDTAKVTHSHAHTHARTHTQRHT